jgi:CMP/dCMP kinase
MGQKKKITIAIDGHSSCGKSTLAKALARELGYTFIDSGAMYRGIALFSLRNGLINEGVSNKSSLIEQLPFITIAFSNTNNGTQSLILNGENVEEAIRTPEVASVVSSVAAIPEVREKLVQEQRKMGKNGGIVMDGRDIGTVVFPDAELKLFVTADPDVRAQRRFKELQDKGIKTSFEEVRSNLLERDHIDSTRATSPLLQAEDAILLDTSNLTREEQLTLALQYAKNILR